jgi:hypothetical protein
MPRPPEPGNATAAASLSVSAAVSFPNAVIEALPDIIGMPHAIGTSDACAGSKDSPITMTTSIVMTNVLLNELPSSIHDDIGDRR